MATKREKTLESIKELTGNVSSKVGKAGANAFDRLKEVDYKGIAQKTGDKLSSVVSTVKEKAQGATKKTSEAMVTYFDENGNGEIDIEDVIIKGLRIPGIRINREAFLRKELFKLYDQSVIDEAVRSNPMNAGIKTEDIDKIANEVINYERNCVSGISAALGVPGGAAMVATIPADIAQYYGYLLRATQKLLYLYGFPEIDVEEDGSKFDSETINILIICFGVMYGAAGANNAIKAIAKAFATGVEKKLLKAALTKGTIYPIVKQVATWFGKKMTKEVFAGFFKKAIPLVGGVVGGGITFLSFKPCCVKLQKSLQDTILSNKNYKEEHDMVPAIDVEFSEIIEDLPEIEEIK